MGIIEQRTIQQIGFVVKDIETSAKKFAEIFGFETPTVSILPGYEFSKTKFNGEPALEATCKLAFFKFANIQVELIEPNEAPSTWREFLETKGEGIHHIAFNVENGDKVVSDFEKIGIPVQQEGIFKNQKGRYIYMDARKDLKCVIELLENFPE